MRPSLSPKEPAPLFKADRVTITVSREIDGKLRVLYGGWEDARVVLPDHALELRAGPQGVEARIVERPVERVTGLEAEFDEGDEA
jgi:hypothetical protein